MPAASIPWPPSVTSEASPYPIETRRYSYFNATSGPTRLARHAGAKLASSAAPIKSGIMMANAAGGLWHFADYALCITSELPVIHRPTIGGVLTL